MDNDEKSRRCADCSFVYYLNPSSACVAVIIDGQGRLLVERRGREPGKGTLDLPGGFADFCETVEEGLCREVLEETGLKVVSSEYLFSLPNEYFFSGCACAYFQVAVDTFTDLRFRFSEWENLPEMGAFSPQFTQSYD